VTALPPLDALHETRPDDIAAFAANGHVLVRGLASADEVAAYRPHLEAVASEINPRLWPPAP
jgi:hypothetical protein